MKDLGRTLNNIISKAVLKTSFYNQTKADLISAALAFRRLQRRHMKVQNKEWTIQVLTSYNRFGENFIRALDDLK